jgi:hypothetical protein
MKTFDHVCERLGVPIAKEKTEGPMTKLEYLGLTQETISKPLNHQTFFLIPLYNDKVVDAFAVAMYNVLLNVLKILFHIDNLAVVSILTSMSTKSDRVLKVLRFIVYRSLIGNFHLKKRNHLNNDPNFVNHVLD